MADGDAGVIERREFKYLIPPERLPALRSALAGWCSLDRYARKGGRYAIRSLYLDTSSLRLARENMLEAHTRYKVRVRAYPGTDAPVFLEVKRRYGDVIAKIRARLDEREWPSVLTRVTAHPSPAVDAFVSLVRTQDLRPIALVEYDREAWMSDVDDYARVTFDFAIGCQAADGADLFPRSFARRPIDHVPATQTPDPRVVLELKFAAAPPGWMRRLVERFELERHAFSKYVGSVEELTRSRDLVASPA